MLIKKKFTILIIIFLVNFNHKYIYAGEENCIQQKKILGTAFVSGFNKTSLKTYGLKPEYIPQIKVKSTINLSDKDISELHIKKNKKPFGLQLSKTMFLKPRVSASYLMNLLEDFNSKAGLYSEELQSEIESRLGKNDENTAEGGFEIIYFF